MLMRIKIAGLFLFVILSFLPSALHAEFKQSFFAGSFYPDDPERLKQTVDALLSVADPNPPRGRVLAIISPHAGYDYSGSTAAYSYKLIKDKPYKTVVILGCSHRVYFEGARVYDGEGVRTPLGEVPVDKDFVSLLLGKDEGVIAGEQAFGGEHSIEVQLPFLQRTLKDFRIVPILLGKMDLSACRRLAALLKEAIGGRDDVLPVLSSDMCHSYDYKETAAVDKATLEAVERADPEELYNGLERGVFQLCGGTAVVTGILLAREMGGEKAEILKHTDSAEVTGARQKGNWTVGYCAAFIGGGDNRREETMFTREQKKELLRIARDSIVFFLEKGKKLQLKEENYPSFRGKLGAFVTLRKAGQLRGCIGNMVGVQPLCLTIRDMAVEAAVNDPRFVAVEPGEMKDIGIEISVLSPLEKADSADDIVMGTHGVMVRNGFRSGVFLPQVAVETGWSKEEFLDELCRQKAGLPADAWKNSDTDLYIFTADIFSEDE
ncbi:MAG: AmmeMemoRadiSam system protein B [Elusimicrobia bacterium]|nr:AmmeMemoRadiSam system protein B [Elusimicrobiota bacterium]